MEAMWGRLAEWAADDGAVGDRAGDSVWLAEALVRCARLGRCGEDAGAGYVFIVLR